MAGRAFAKAVVPIFTLPFRFVSAAGVLAARARVRFPQAVRILRVTASHRLSAATACAVDVLTQHGADPAASILTAPLATIGLASPAGAVVVLQAVAGNITAGAHSWKITRETAIGETQLGGKSNVLVADAGHGKATVPLPPIMAGQVGWKVYRTVAGDAGDHLLVDTVTPATAGGTPAAPTFEDDVADGALGAAGPAVNVATDGVVMEENLTCPVDGAPGRQVAKEDELTVDVQALAGGTVSDLCVQVDYVPVD